MRNLTVRVTYEPDESAVSVLVRALERISAPYYAAREKEAMDMAAIARDALAVYRSSLGR